MLVYLYFLSLSKIILKQKLYVIHFGIRTYLETDQIYKANSMEYLHESKFQT